MTAWTPPRRLQGGCKTEFRWLWIDFLFIVDWFLIDFALIVHWFLNDEWQMMNAEWTMINAEWWMMMDDEWSRPSCVTESTELVHITRGKTELIPSWLCNRKHSSSSKCSTEKSHQFISKVSQKLDYCLSTHIRIPSQPRCVTESTESVYFTKGKTEFHPKLVV